MYRRVFVRNQVDPAADQRILNTCDGRLVTGNLARGIDHRVTLLQLDTLMGAGSNLGHGGTWFALRAGADDDDVVAWEQINILFRDKIGKIAQIADFLRGRYGPLDRPAHHGNRPVVRLGGADD